MASQTQQTRESGHPYAAQQSPKLIIHVLSKAVLLRDQQLVCRLHLITTESSVFHYVLSDDQPTRIARHHLVAALNPDTDRGNMTGETKAAIDSFLGPEADGGDNKVVINYHGAISPATDARPLLKTERTRFVTVPALLTLAPTLARYGRE